MRWGTTDRVAGAGIEAGRLERCLDLQAEPLGRGRYFVSGGYEPHWVDLRSPRMPRCDCGDHLWREVICKHILAALLREGDERVIREVGALVRELRAELSVVRRAAAARRHWARRAA